MKIGNFLGLPWYLRLLLFLVIAGAVYTGFRYFVTGGTRAETAELNEKIAALLPQNAQAQIASQRLNDFRAAYNARQQEYEELKALLPEQRELTSVLQGVQERARSSNLSVRRFFPKDDVQQDFYSGKKIEVGVTSSFAGLRSFFDQMAKYQRIVSITNFEIKQLDKQRDGKTIDSRFDLTAYYVSAEKLQQAKPAAPAAAPVATTPATPNAPAK
ncbi:MAG TPA: type 4a pilus biogenesis protein PilO [Pyrinomonadaceae bacterium]|jgi:Tfp pilus assembly protein PilO|nr:type 4a pilus biogenesis protein PilO [Pyrinomonadaceae bacterium]